ncbi:c-type cytochrome [Virgibacillus dakarensis]|uniref:Cytochrome c n=1 Tax=Lentibacillus populi TaxID=1827502 RepID=A0A9W5X480_9BACI|nr:MULTISPECIES: cytochrome c [Bacillaceae]MBT2214487.1 cytochrome c [Virgibacillus dakarensis]MTW84092.1 c-type cytochrome [Virgibacillus dakarensis]GGB29149.1 cytochrome c [Lentibacillus populi]
MKKNPVIPYALIAVIGIALVIVISIVGIDQREAIQKAEEGGDTQQSAEDKGEGASTDDPEAIFENTCASCHGADLSGGMGPNLQKVGGKLSKDEIKNTILNGKGQMPAGLVPDDQAEALAKWLSEKK